MIDIYCHCDNEAERTYAVDILFNELLAIPKTEYSIHFCDRSDSYEIKYGTKSIIIEDHFFLRFPEPLSYLHQDNIPTSLNFFHAFELEIPIIYGEDRIKEEPDHITIGLDVFASAFFMLSRWEEYCMGRNETGRCKSVTLFCSHFCIDKRPIVHEYEELLRLLFAKIGLSYPNTREYNVVMTHDIDGILTPTIFDIAKAWYRQKRHGMPKKTPTVLSAKDMLVYKKHYPNAYRQFQRYIDICKKYQVEEWFYFKVCDSGEEECTYRYDDRRLKRIVRRLKSEHSNQIKLGFHPSQSTFNNEEQWMKELIRIKEVLGNDIQYGRNHHMLYNCETNQAWERSNISVISNQAVVPVGFRSGIAVAYQLFDIYERRPMMLKEVPTPIIDSSIRLYHYQSEEAMLSDVDDVIESVKRHRGTLLLTWHIYLRKVSLLDKYYDICNKVMERSKCD